jgi:hypothetical protein
VRSVGGDDAAGSVRVGGSTTAAEQLADINAALIARYGSISTHAGAYGNVPGSVGNVVIDHFAGMLARAIVSTMGAAPELVLDDLAELKALWKAYSATPSLQDPYDVEQLWDVLTVVADWIDTNSSVSPTSLNLALPPPFGGGKKKPPGRKTGSMGWLMLIAALYLAQRELRS